MSAESAAARERDRLCSTAHSRAKQRLVDVHRDEFRSLFNEERAAVGLPPVQPGWDGGLTVAQEEILRLVREGQSLAEIARLRGVTRQMVHQTLWRARAKVGEVAHNVSAPKGGNGRQSDGDIGAPPATGAST